MSVKSERPPEYSITDASGDKAVKKALGILESRMRVPGVAMASPKDTTDYLKLKLAERPYEVFGVIFADNRHRVITLEEMFRGTIDGASVHPREVVKRALQLNAASVILFHNHPSGNPEPSEADKRITARLKEALALIEIRVLDHVIVGGMETFSFAERGYL
jgi:DNA repair protein RadC